MGKRRGENSKTSTDLASRLDKNSTKKSRSRVSKDTNPPVKSKKPPKKPFPLHLNPSDIKEKFLPHDLRENPLFNAIHRPNVRKDQLAQEKKLSSKISSRTPTVRPSSDLGSRVTNVKIDSTISSSHQKELPKKSTEGSNRSARRRKKTSFEERINHDNQTLSYPKVISSSQEEDHPTIEHPQPYSSGYYHQPEESFPLGPAAFRPRQSQHNPQPSQVAPPPQQAVFSIRYASKPPVVQIRNLAPGTTAEDVTTVVERIGSVAQCRTRDVNNSVQAEILFDNGKDAETIVEQFNNSYADGRLISAKITREFSIPEYVAAIKPVVAPPYVSTWDGPPLYSDGVQPRRYA